MVLRQSPESLNMFFQQMKSLRSFKIEENNGTGLTPSIAVANNDKTPNELPTDLSRLKENWDAHSPTNNDSNCYLPSVISLEKTSTD